ncbi:helix-turn-helix transcriptional regulator [Saccharomonospora viridis]|jgi:predicted ArsR family transcriptional regulator|uniref:Predicted transcriptional regulator n=2 Tax=Saccharomonospora viridis TaxID=1852 RepID=C7MRY4_SACVD|nr:helix-turn-helix domain-containing protein [Saccharomonospora viridis]ACU98840.1 predicted transcriptional regulator [Saccharomonospora viridis DSM 43017]KHF44637.1 ArsR family transcriptional regulator [Saccharomonospora viridis]SFP24007.1 Predicted transcriptional regulator, ArsR family [Saccharomonospora viridis]
MPETSLTDEASGPALGRSRTRVLELLRTTDGPLTAHQVAQRVGFHVNTARFHLDALVEAGLAQRGTEGAGRPGRPRMVYRAVAHRASEGPRSYRLLATMLSTLIDRVMPEPREAAIAAGREWGRYLAKRPAPFEHVDAEEGIRRVANVLAEAGFAPGEVSGAGPRVLPLRHCPFQEVARVHGDVVCSLHLGLMQGVLAEVGAPVTARRLEPFVEPSLCLAHFDQQSA